MQTIKNIGWSGDSRFIGGGCPGANGGRKAGSGRHFGRDDSNADQATRRGERHRRTTSNRKFAITINRPWRNWKPARIGPSKIAKFAQMIDLRGERSAAGEGAAFRVARSTRWKSRTTSRCRRSIRRFRRSRANSRKPARNWPPARRSRRIGRQRRLDIPQKDERRAGTTCSTGGAIADVAARRGIAASDLVPPGFAARPAPLLRAENCNCTRRNLRPTRPRWNCFPCSAIWPPGASRRPNRISNIGTRRRTGGGKRRPKSKFARPGSTPPGRIRPSAAWPAKTPRWPKPASNSPKKSPTPRGSSNAPTGNSRNSRCNSSARGTKSKRRA